jgi:hypothetical protein
MRGRPLPVSRQSSRAAVVVVLSLAALAIGSACGTEPVGVESCQKIERVRCESAQACGINLGRPAHQGETEKDAVAACIRYYDDQCLHGLAAPKDPGPQIVDACVKAIITGDCDIVKEPEKNDACKFLVPPTAPLPSDAAAEAEAAASSG